MQARNEMDRQLSSTSGIECITLGRRDNVSILVKFGLIKLIRDDEPLDIDILREGGLDAWTICTLLSVRKNRLLSRNPISVTGSSATGAQHVRSALEAGKATADLQLEQVKCRLRHLGVQEALDLVQNRFDSLLNSVNGDGKNEL